ncbi:splicing factor ESS-2 homolog [Argonauta hians]
MALETTKYSGVLRKVRENIEGEAKIPVKKKKKTVLDEDTYIEGLQKIIQRDFFPDLPKWKAQAEFFDAVENNDLSKLREIQLKYGLRRPETGSSSVYNTPDTFETPEGGLDKSPSNSERTSFKDKPDNTSEKNEESDPVQMDTLDTYLSKHTSEDNASFTEILKETQRKHREKHAWLYDREERQNIEHEEKLALPSIEKQASIEKPPPSLHSWQYSAKNSLMYVPDGSELTPEEKMEKSMKKRDIVHNNTRFNLNPFNSEKNKEILQQVASEKAHANLGKIGHDGKEVHTGYSPMINGYGFVKTPSPMPGMGDESPLMTWGEIEGTPFRLDGTDNTPLPKTPGPTFKIPELPKRDRIALELAERASKAHRLKKQDALRRVTQRLTSPSSLSPCFGMSSTDKLNSMSPAAQRLANSSLRIKSNTDKALRASYSPSRSPSPLSRHKSSFLTPDLKSPGSGSFRGSGGMSDPRSISAGVKPGARSRSPGNRGRDGGGDQYRRSAKTGTDSRKGGGGGGSSSHSSSTSRGGISGSDTVANSPSLTDNLLNLPDRMSASDFF